MFPSDKTYAAGWAFVKQISIDPPLDKKSILTPAVVSLFKT